MKVYLVRGYNSVGEAEVEVVVSANGLLEAEKIAKEQEIVDLMVCDGVLVDFEVEESVGPFHLMSFPLQGM